MLCQNSFRVIQIDAGVGNYLPKLFIPAPKLPPKSLKQAFFTPNY